jgi:hypothetical protein
MILPDRLETKDIVNAVVSAIALLVSVISVRISRRNAKASIYFESQKFLIEVCKQLISEPVLWCVFDDEPLRNNTAVYKPNDPQQDAKLRGFAHLHLNMFEIVVNEAPRPISRILWYRILPNRSNASNVWYAYLHDTFTRSRMIREVLETERPIWSPALYEELVKWRERTGNGRKGP